VYDSLFDLQPAGARSLPLGAEPHVLFREASIRGPATRVERKLSWTLVGQLSMTTIPSDADVQPCQCSDGGKKGGWKTFSNEFGEFVYPICQTKLRLCVRLSQGQQIDSGPESFHESSDPERIRGNQHAAAKRIR